MSVEMEMHVKGLPELREKLAKLGDIMKGRVHDAMVFESEAMKSTAQQLAPIRTGYLMSTIFGRVEDWVLKLGATAPYAAYQEFGTRYIRARRFLSHAVELGMQSLIDRINHAIEEAKTEASH